MGSKGSKISTPKQRRNKNTYNKQVQLQDNIKQVNGSEETAIAQYERDHVLVKDEPAPIDDIETKHLELKKKTLNFGKLKFDMDILECHTEHRVLGASNASQITDWLKKLRANEMRDLCNQTKQRIAICCLCFQIIFSEEFLFFIVNYHSNTDVAIPILPPDQLIEHVYQEKVKQFINLPNFDCLEENMRTSLKIAIQEGCKIVKAWTTLKEGLKGSFFFPLEGELFNEQFHEPTNMEEEEEEKNTNKYIVSKVKFPGYKVGINNIVYLKAVVSIKQGE